MHIDDELSMVLLGVAWRYLSIACLRPNLSKRIYLWWSLRSLYLHACPVRVTVGDSCLCCCTCATYFER